MEDSTTHPQPDDDEQAVNDERYAALMAALSQHIFDRQGRAPTRVFIHGPTEPHPLIAIWSGEMEMQEHHHLARLCGGFAKTDEVIYIALAKSDDRGFFISRQLLTDFDDQGGELVIDMRHARIVVR